MLRTMRYSTFILNVPFFNFKVTCLITCLLLYWPKIHKIFVHFSLFWHGVRFFLFPSIKIITIRYKKTQKRKNSWYKVFIINYVDLLFLQQSRCFLARLVGVKMSNIPFHFKNTLKRMSSDIQISSTFRKRKRDKDMGNIFLTYETEIKIL